MMMHNPYTAPGTYKHTGSDQTIVVTNVVTHHYFDGEMKPVRPAVVYRDLLSAGPNHVAYMMDLETFKTKFYQL